MAFFVSIFIIFIFFLYFIKLSLAIVAIFSDFSIVVISALVYLENTNEEYPIAVPISKIFLGFFTLSKVLRNSLVSSFIIGILFSFANILSSRKSSSIYISFRYWLI